MKKTTVMVAVNGWGRGSAPGWATDVPGLVCAQLELETTNKKKQWILFHEPSGWRVKSCDKRGECNKLANAIADLADWTLPKSEILQLPIFTEISRRHYAIREAVGTTRTDDGGTPIERTTTP